MKRIHLKGVSKHYSKSKIISNVNISIEKGDLFGVIGKSGSGKTTLLNMIAGISHPTLGKISFVSLKDKTNHNFHENFSKIKKFIGYMSQQPSFYPKLTVIENLMHFGKLYGLDKKILINNAKNLLHFTDLYNHRNKLAEHLSGGMKKRLDLSCSLIHKPRLLILDEPTSDLDPLLETEIMNLIHEVNKQGVTIIIASHHFDGVERICNKLAIIHSGEVYAFGEVHEIKKPYIKDHMTITIKVGRNKEEFLDYAKHLELNKIVDQGHQIILYPKNIEKTMLDLLKIVQKQNLMFRDIDLREASLNQIFSDISQQ